MSRAAAEAWEGAFVELARTQLSAMAAAAGLRLSFSAERSVADELARESYADVGTVRRVFTPQFTQLPSHGDRAMGVMNQIVQSAQGIKGLACYMSQCMPTLAVSATSGILTAPPISVHRKEKVI